jgi:hypothetical protein
MRATILALTAFLALSAPVLANDAPASDASIREMLQLSNAQQLVDGVKGQVNAMMSQTLKQATQGRPVSPEKQAILDDMRAKMTAAFDDTLSWDALQPMYTRVYKAAFTQDEIDGIIKFYKSRAGKAMIKKLPVVLTHVMTEMQGLMQPTMQKIREIQSEAMEKIKALPPDQQSPAAGAPAAQP